MCSVFNSAGSSISGDVTPVSAASELDFNSNEATAGSITDHDLLSAEGEDDEETLSVDGSGSLMKVIKNDLGFHDSETSTIMDNSEASTSSAPLDLYGLSFQETKETFYKDIPSSSKNFNIESDIKNKCIKDRLQYCSNLESLNLQSKDNKNKSKNNAELNNGSRRYSDSSAHKSKHNSQTAVSGSRFTTTLVSEDLLKAGSSSESKSNNNLVEHDQGGPLAVAPLVTKAKTCNVKPGFTIAENQNI
ncbi:unnamed protein product [Euphydryas editha]|uniref:Uncharacterized protein n=1 Tax=Euphydryas editha TaxID=104508 RepID=A0AAU9TJ85_EUPED|nr:unnamed protein product [Euphydryas editha]